MCFALPSPDNVARNGKEVVGGNQGGGGHRGCLIDNGGLDQSLDTLYCRTLLSLSVIDQLIKFRSPFTYINDAAQGSDGIGPVQNVAAHRSVLHNDTCRHDHILGGSGQFFQNQIDHLPQ